MTRLADEIESLRGLITSNFRHAQTISDQADSLKSISQAMRASEEDHVWDRFLKPIFMETLLVLDDLGKARSALASGAADTANQILAGIETQIDQLLARHDITPMSATPDSFDPNCQKVVGIRSVPPVKSGIVESRPRRGYRYKNRVFRYEEVVIINPVKE
jgi:molecular chaperone GrpE (heat shock protein)